MIHVLLCKKKKLFVLHIVCTLSPYHLPPPPLHPLPHHRPPSSASTLPPKIVLSTIYNNVTLIDSSFRSRVGWRRKLLISFCEKALPARSRALSYYQDFSRNCKANASHSNKAMYTHYSLIRVSSSNTYQLSTLRRMQSSAVALFCINFSAHAIVKIFQSGRFAGRKKPFIVVNLETWPSPSTALPVNRHWRLRLRS